MLLARIVDLYSLVVLVAVVLSWTDISPRHPLARVVAWLTEPLLGPISRVLPAVAGLDLSPMVLLFILQAFRRSVFA